MTPAGPLLLVGPQRSGTTALAGAFASAFAKMGGCFTVNGKLPYLLRRWWTDMDANAQHLRADEVAHALTRFPPQGAGAEAWLARAQAALLDSSQRAAHNDMEPTTGQEIRRICAEAYGQGPWGDKYNEYLLELPWLHATFPDARWVFLVREPEETVASMLGWRRNKPWNPEIASAASAKWAYWTSGWLDFRASVPVRSRVEVDYGSLCDGGHDTLSEFVGVDLAPHLAEFRRRAADRPIPPLCINALSVRAELVRIGILGDSRERP